MQVQPILRMRLAVHLMYFLHYTKVNWNCKCFEVHSIIRKSVLNKAKLKYNHNHYFEHRIHLTEILHVCGFFFYPCFLLIQFFTEDWSTTGLLYFDMKICRRHCNAQESCSCKEISILTFLRMWFQFSKPSHFPPSFEHISITLCVLYLTKSLCAFSVNHVYSLTIVIYDFLYI